MRFVHDGTKIKSLVRDIFQCAKNIQFFSKDDLEIQIIYSMLLTALLLCWKMFRFCFVNPQLHWRVIITMRGE